MLVGPAHDSRGDVLDDSAVIVTEYSYQESYMMLISEGI